MTEADRRADFENFAGRNRARLLRAYDAVAAGRVPFCWPGLLFPQAWFLYRKMYALAALVTVVPFSLGGLPGGPLLGWFGAALGALGLKLYVARAQRVAGRLRAQYPPEEADALIARAGGVSLIGAAVGAGYKFAVFVLTLKAGAPSAFGLR